MNNWKLRFTFDSNEDSDYIEVNGHLANLSDGNFTVDIIPFGNQFAAALRTGSTDTFGPVSNQVPGICNGTFTHTSSANGQVASTTLTGKGSGATFSYGFIADGTLSFIRAATGGSGYKVGDKLQITTNQGHVIEFRLVDGSNATEFTVQANHENQSPFPFAVHRARVGQSTEKTLYVFDYRSSQVFPRPQDKLLDKYPDAAAAYGLRLLRSAYLGPAIRVRRESTGWPEIDIHFDGQGNLDTKALLDFAGTSSVRVKTWYDQSGNVRNAGQGTNAAQPTIVDAGTLVTVNGKPALDFDGSDDRLFAGHDGLYGQARLDAYMHYQSDDNTYVFFADPDSNSRYSFVPEDGSDVTALSGQYTTSGQTRTLYVNGVEIPSVGGAGGNTRDDLHTALITNGAKHSTGAVVVHQGAGTSTWTSFGISTYPTGTTYLFDGKVTEMVLYNTDQSANREDIEKDMALHSGAFQVEDAPLLDAYGGAHAAYSLRKLNSDYTGSAIRIRKGGSTDEKDVGFDANGNIDEATILGFGTQDVYVTKWYDQSGNGNDLVQSATTKQPHLRTNAGVEQRVDGRLAMKFDGSSDHFPLDSSALDIGNLSTFLVCKANSTGGTQFPLRLSGITGDKRWYGPLLQSGNFRYMYGVYNLDVTATANTNNNLHTMIAGATQGNFEAFFNGTSAGTRTTLKTGVDNTSTGVGSQGGTQNFFNGHIEEFIIYSSDQSERREGIERNISNHYDL